MRATNVLEEDETPPTSERERAAWDEHASNTGSLLERTFARFAGISGMWFVALLVASVPLRIGFNRFEKFDRMLACLAAFPVPDHHYRCRNIVVVALPALLHADSPESWWELHSLLTGAVLLGTLALVAWRHRARVSFRTTALWLALSAMPVTLLHQLGHYDVYTVAGGSLVGLARGWPTALVGGLLMGASHPEQAVVGMLSLAAVALALEKHRDWSVKMAGVGVLVGIAATKLYILLSKVGGVDRAELFLPNLSRSLWNATQNGVAGVYACYGVSWLLVGAWLLAAPLASWRKALVFAGLIALPGLTSLTTLDGTRVFLCTCWPAFAFFVSQLCDERESKASHVPLRSLTALALLLSLVMPAYITQGSILTTPRLGSYLNRIFPSFQP